MDCERIRDGKLPTPPFVALYQNKDGSVHDKILPWMDTDNPKNLNCLGSWPHRFLIDDFMYNKITVLKEFQYFNREPDKEDNIITRNQDHYIFMLWFDDITGLHSRLLHCP